MNVGEWALLFMKIGGAFFVIGVILLVVAYEKGI